MMEWLELQVLGNSLWAWLSALALALLSLTLLRAIKGLAARHAARIAPSNGASWGDVLLRTVEKTKSLFLLLIAFYIGSLLLDLAPRAHAILSSIAIVALLLQAGVWGGALILALVTSQRREVMAKNPAATTVVDLISLIARVVLWSVILLLALDNIGIDVTALVAGLGIGGIAIALAIQNILSDLFASLSILLDKPFAVGDFLILDDYLGSVEHIGLKTTRLRSLSGEQLIFSNSDLLNSRVRNYGRMFERRVVFKLGVVYDTSRENIELIPALIRAAVTAQKLTRFDRSHFMNYGAYALEFETVYYVSSSDYNLYMDIQQAIYLALHRAFEAEGISFAYPTQSLLLTHLNAVTGAPQQSATGADKSSKPAPTRGMG